MLSSGLGSTGLKAVVCVLISEREASFFGAQHWLFSLPVFSLFPHCSICLCFSPRGQCPWHVLQHICLKYARLQNLNFSTNGQYATLFTSLHSRGRGKKVEWERIREGVSKWLILGNHKRETWKLVKEIVHPEMKGLPSVIHPHMTFFALVEQKINLCWDCQAPKSE